MHSPEDQSLTRGMAFTPHDELLYDIDIKDYCETDCFSHFVERVKSLDGQFRVVTTSSESLFAAVDIRSTLALFYRVDGKTIHVSDNGFDLLCKGDEMVSLTSDEALFFSRWGFLPNDKTLSPHIKRLEAGCALCFSFEEGKIQVDRYDLGLSLSREFTRLKYGDALTWMHKVYGRAFDRMARVIGDRHVILPLTAGRDSRLIAIALKERGIENVLTLTYGRDKGIREVLKAQSVAKQLGFRHQFICTVPPSYDKRGYTQDEEALSFLRYISGLASGYYFAEYTSARWVLSAYGAQGPIVLSGHNGGVLAGDNLNVPYSNGVRACDCCAYQLTLLERGDRRLTREEVMRLTEIQKDMLHSYPDSLSLREKLDLMHNREMMSKYYLNSSRSWGYFGIPVWVPFLDKELSTLMHSLPPGYRMGKKIYEDFTDTCFKRHKVSYGDDFHLSKVVESPLYRLKQIVRPHIAYQLSRKSRLFVPDDMGFSTLMGGTLLDEVRQQIPWTPTTSNGLSFAWWLYYVQRYLSDTL